MKLMKANMASKKLEVARVHFASKSCCQTKSAKSSKFTFHLKSKINYILQSIVRNMNIVGKSEHYTYVLFMIYLLFRKKKCFSSIQN